MASFQAPEGFERLTDVVFLYTPGPDPDVTIAPTLKNGNTDAPPDLILLATWMGAGPRHVLKYTSGYQSLFPFARIVLIVNGPSDIILYSAKAQRKRVEPVVEIIKSTTNKTPGRKPRILLQTMSNGGAYQISKVAEVFKETEGLPLPVNAIIVDSAPGKDSISGSTRAFMLGLPKSWIVQTIGAVVMYGVMVFSVVAQTLTWQEQIVTGLRKNLLDKSLFNPSASRCYIYSKADEMVWWKDVQEHASEARATGWHNVEEVVFESSAHCGHMRTHEKEYWDAVLTTWKTGAS
ncbi:DUF829-domain-containing protein [Mytilinidion resinicola]|uniref:DUF829-domain-containing protein n=1 Tax=Mytilinidion resinicola TaxID=574789 RepID=A0A6A6Z4T8_9PEZI|nr:DUF829-domain-containing protein [Mytilinidion resinicola]KAF2816086.1 DUF829-domain-containing protein [Mytilinidion resinicola]